MRPYGNETLPANADGMFVRAEGESFEDFTKRAWREAAEEVKGESIKRERRELRHRHRQRSTNSEHV